MFFPIFNIVTELFRKPSTSLFPQYRSTSILFEISSTTVHDVFSPKQRFFVTIFYLLLAVKRTIDTSFFSTVQTSCHFASFRYFVFRFAPYDLQQQRCLVRNVCFDCSLAVTIHGTCVFQRKSAIPRRWMVFVEENTNVFL